MLQVPRQKLGNRRVGLYGRWTDLSKETDKSNTVQCLPNLPDYQNPLGSLLEIKAPRPHPNLLNQNLKKTPYF